MNTFSSSFRRAALVTAVAVATACGGGDGSSSGGDASSAATYPLVLVATSRQGNVSAATFDGASWVPLAPIPMPAPSSGGGITMLRDGRTVVAMIAGYVAPFTHWSATLTGTTWSTTTTFAMNAGFELSVPVPTDSGAVVLVDETTGTLHLATFDGTSSTWTSDENTGVGAGPPGVVVSSRRGSDLFVLGWSRMHSNQYAWSRRTQGTWSPPADVPAPITCMSDCFTAEIAAVRRGGTDAIVAAFAGTPNEPPLLRAATFSGGTWSPSVTLATNGSVANRALAITALRDGRVALAYVAPDGGVWVGFFDGTTWGPFLAIGVGVSAAVDTATVPVALAPGRDSHAVVELVFVEMHTLAVRHVRLLDASTWTWSPPVTVGAMSGGSVGLATTPVP